MSNNKKEIINNEDYKLKVVEWIGQTDKMTISYDFVIPDIYNPSRVAGLLEAGGGAEQPSNDESSFFEEIKISASDLEKLIVNYDWDPNLEKADKIDYAVSICCGVLAGIVDSFFVGEWSLDSANEWGNEKVARFVEKVAAKHPNYKGNSLEDAITFMEDNYHIPADKVTPEMGGGRQHHLRDFSHHFSIGGLICSIFTQFTGLVIGTDTNGSLIIVPVDAEALIGKNTEEKIAFGIITWFFHMVSDMAGSSASPGKGTGIPGPILSLIKELSAVPIFRDKKIGEYEFHTWVSKLFNGTLLAKRDEAGKILEPVKFDLRTEIGLLHQVGRAFVPVIINECLIRGFYFFRALHTEIKELNIKTIEDISKIEAERILPYNNRKIKRMITVSSGTFVIVDSGDAAIRALVKNKGVVTNKFWIDFAVRLNYPGIGRFVIACASDIHLSRTIEVEERIKRDKALLEFDRQISDLDCLTLSAEQLRILYSLEKLIVNYDISNSKGKNRKWKEKWLNNWEAIVLSGLPIIGSEKSDYFMSEDEIYSLLKEEENLSVRSEWVDLVVLEAINYKPYLPFHLDKDDKNKNTDDKQFEKLELQSDYIIDVFCANQLIVSVDTVKKLKKEQKKYFNAIGGNTTKKIIMGAGTIAGVAVTGGAAFFFAPAIAPVIAGALFGESIAGLSGAALTSASLALLGGGSLAVGGLGMAGGTAVIAGGGALLGLAGGAGASAASMTLLSNDSLVLYECSKLIAYSSVILAEKYADPYSVADIQYSVEARIAELRSQLEQYKEISKEDKNAKERIKVSERSLKYFDKCNALLTGIIEENRISGIGKYKGFNPRFYTHELDKETLKALRSIPGFTPALKTFMKYWNEKQAHIINMGTLVRISDEQLPQYYNMLPPICEKLGIDVPELYLELDVIPNAYTSGETNPYIVITSGLLETLPEDLIPTVLAHECGHIACHHVLYRMMGMLLLDGAFNMIGMIPLLGELGDIISYPLEVAFFNWMRASEFSADRAAVLCDGSADKMIEVCLRLAGFDRDINGTPNIEAFMNQAREYKEMMKNSKTDKAMEFFMFAKRSHPIMAVRALECSEWANSKEFNKLIESDITMKC